jgi:hypothetical protein
MLILSAVMGFTREMRGLSLSDETSRGNLTLRQKSRRNRSPPQLLGRGGDGKDATGEVVLDEVTVDVV